MKMQGKEYIMTSEIKHLTTWTFQSRT